MNANKKRKREEDDPIQSTSIVFRKEKKNSKKYNRYRDTSSVVIKGPRIVPDSFSTKLTYTLSSTIASSLGAYGHQIWRGNSLYDPDLTGTGTQPAGYNELVAFYENYRVTGSSIELVAYSNNSTIPDDLVLRPQPSSVLIGSNQDVFSELPYAERRSGYSKETKLKFKQYMSSNKILGVKKDAIRIDDQFQAVVGTNPENQWFWVLTYQPADKAASQGMYYTAKITYYCTFFSRQTLNQS